MANILYIGDSFYGSTSRQRAEAIIRLGHTVDVRDSYKAMAKYMRSWVGAVHYRTGYTLLQSRVEKWLSEVLQSLTIRPDVIWVDMGEHFGPRCVTLLKTRNCPIVLYNVDDPTGPRDGNRFKSVVKSIPLYDLIALVRKETVEETQKLGGKKVVHVYRSYDEIAHKPFSSQAEIPHQFRSEVAFIGTWMRYEGRDEFMLKLIEQNVPVSIWGDRWQKSPHFLKLKPYWRGGALSGRDYVAAIQGAKICLGMLSKGNRDLHTQRSLEVPYAGGLFCAQRTEEHQEMYKEGIEAVFWSDANECADVCNKLLKDEALRENIRLAGMQRVRALKLGNEDVCRKLLTMVLEPKP